MRSETIQGLQEAQRGMARTIATMKPGSDFDEAIRFGTMAGFQYAVSITHVDTGALRASHRMKLERGSKGIIYIDPNAVRPATGTMAGRARPSQYGPVENARGGEHAFYARVPKERGPTIAREAAAAMIRSWGHANS